MLPLIHRWLGGHRPKQYCTFVGARSMFQHTLDRADMLISPAHRVTVAGEKAFLFSGMLAADSSRCNCRTLQQRVSYPDSCRIE